MPRASQTSWLLSVVRTQIGGLALAACMVGAPVAAAGGDAPTRPISVPAIRPSPVDARAIASAVGQGGGAPERLVRAANAVPTPEALAFWHDLLGSEPHSAGTPGDERVISRIRDAMVDMGLCTTVEEFWAPLPQPQDALLEIVGAEVESDPIGEPGARRGVIPLSIVERNLLEDPASQHPGLTFGWNAFSGSADVTAEVVYANYATKADFELLRAKGVDVKGRIVLARYGGNFRGYKWKFAEEAGAVGLVIFTDPQDAGDRRGKTYPEGGWANDTCIQRGSILATDQPGDPQTPFVASTESAVRGDISSLALPRIPVQPIGYASAAQIISRMEGELVEPKSGWQGGLPLAYRLTGGPELRLRLRVEQDRTVRRTANVIGVLPGSTRPDECVVIGCHHDAWGFGAADPLAGTIVLMESARSFAEAVRHGYRPQRTIIFAAWGAEEYGIFGSTEWVEAHRAWLSEGCVAYINLDMAAMGPNFGAACTPSLHEAVLRATVRVPQARGQGETIYDRISGGGKSEPRFGDLGGGSDHVAFNCHAGIAAVSLGGGGSEGSSYHSNYDTLAWYRQVVGGDYAPALMITRVTNAVAAMLADSPVVPLSAARHGAAAARVLADLRKAATDSDAAAAIGALEARFAALGEQGAQLDAAIASAIPTLDAARAAAVTRALLALDRAWVDGQGLQGRPWYRSLLAASDRDSGYASIMLPLMTEAVQAKDWKAVGASARRYGQVADRLAAAMATAHAAVKPVAARSSDLEQAGSH